MSAIKSACYCSAKVIGSSRNLKSLGAPAANQLSSREHSLRSLSPPPGPLPFRRGEGESSPVERRIDHHRSVERRPSPFPLSEGEGQGEGERGHSTPRRLKPDSCPGASQAFSPAQPQRWSQLCLPLAQAGRPGCSRAAG